VPLDGSGYKQMARGLFNPGGLGLGPEGEFFVTENQGPWKPTNALYAIPVKGDLPVHGRFYGYRRNTNNACGVQPPAVDGSSCPQDPEYPPAIWLPYGYSSGPTRPILLKAGPYAGQTTTAPIFDMLAIRSLKDGFDIEFTQPVSASAEEDSNWSVQTTVYTPVEALGRDSSSKDNNIPVRVTSATLSPDGKHVHLKLASLLTRRLYAIKVKEVASAIGKQEPYSNVGYYTLNNVSPDSGSTARFGGPVGDFSRRIHASLHWSRVAFEVPFHGPWKIDLVRPDGTRVERSAGSGPGRFESASLSPGLYLVAGRAEGSSFSEKVQVR
jgi:hypothetical protein